MTCQESGGVFHYRSARRAQNADCEVIYRPTGPARAFEPGSLAYFLTERYALYTTDSHGTLLRGRIHHEPWPLQPADAQFLTMTVTAPLGLTLSGPPLLHFSRELQVSILDLSPC